MTGASQPLTATSARTTQRESMTTIALPTAPLEPRSSRRRWWVWVLPLAVAALAAAGYWAWTGWSASRADAAANYKFQPVVAGEMQVKVHKDGELQSVENVEIMSMVEGLSTIVQIVKEGAYVNQGDVLVQLD